MSEDKPMTVGDVKRMLASFNDDIPIFVSRERKLAAIFNIEEYTIHDLEGFLLNINDHKFIHEAGSAVALEADYD